MSKDNQELQVKVLPNGPLLINGEIKLTLADGTVEEKSKVHICRCGGSNNKPFCDGTHAKIDFKG